MLGYYNNPEASAAALTNDRWLRTGDWGYKKGSLYFISSRRTDLILRGAENVYPQEIELIIPIIVDSRKGNIGGDPEGVALYKTSATEGYVVLSSQGDNKYNLYNRKAPYAFITSFQISDQDGGIDGTSETDGISVSSFNFGGEFSKGLMVRRFFHI